MRARFRIVVRFPRARLLPRSRLSTRRQALDLVYKKVQQKTQYVEKHNRPMDGRVFVCFSVYMQAVMPRSLSMKIRLRFRESYILFLLRKLHSVLTNMTTS